MSLRTGEGSKRKPNYAIASLIALAGRALTALLAGFAANVVGSLVNGLIPSRAGLAGFLTTTNLANPGRMNMPFFLSSLCPIWVSESRTLTTSLRAQPSPMFSRMAAINAPFVSFLTVFVGAFAFGFANRDSPLRVSEAIESTNYTSNPVKT